MRLTQWVERDHEHRVGPLAERIQAGDEPDLNLAVQCGRDGLTIAVALVRQPRIQHGRQVVVQLGQEGSPRLEAKITQGTGREHQVPTGQSPPRSPAWSATRRDARERPGEPASRLVSSALNRSL